MKKKRKDIKICNQININIKDIEEQTMIYINY